MSADRTSQKVVLQRGVDFVSLWEGSVKHWLEGVLRSNWQETGACAIVSPSVRWHYYLKYLILKEGWGALGLSFWTPLDLRDYLVRRYLPEISVGDSALFRLMLASAGMEVREKAGKKGEVFFDSEILWREMERIYGEESFHDQEDPALREVFTAFRKIKQKTKDIPAYEADKLLLEKTGKTEPSINHLALVGFDAKHWPFWNLLNASVQASRDALVCLFAPRLQAEPLDMAWSNSWEERYGASEDFPIRKESPFRDQVASVELNGLSKNSGDEIIFRVGWSPEEEVQAAVLQALSFLREKDAERVGIIVPRKGVFAREICGLLDRLSLEYFDGVGHADSPPSDEYAWEQWFRFQDEGSVIEFFELIKRSPDLFFRLDMPLESLRKLLEEFLAEVMFDSFDLFLVWLKEKHHGGDRSHLIPFVEKFRRLEEKNNFASYLQQTSRAFRDIEWHERADYVERLAVHYAGCRELVSSREDFLKWFKSTAKPRYRVRSDFGNHPYARIAVLTYEQAEHQHFSHAILAGLNEGIFPGKSESSAWLDEEKIRKFNQSILRKGSQGEGHWVVKDGGLICIGPIEESWFQQRQFLNIVESASEKLCVTFSLLDGEGKALPVSDLAVRLYRADRGEILDKERLQELQSLMRQWISQAELEKFFEKPCTDLQQTLSAYRARRDENAPFGEYDFALSGSPKNIPVISAKAFERVLKNPPVSWLDIFLKVSPSSELSSSSLWAMTCGSWVHAWLSAGCSGNSGKWIPLDDFKKGREVLFGKAKTFSEKIRTVFRKAGIPLPYSWKQAWSEAHWMAASLSAGVSESLLEQVALRSEYRLPSGVRIPLDEKTSLLLSGIIDLMILPVDASENFPEDADVWIVDYKTGGDEHLTPSEVKRGKGLQIGLYGLALLAQGASHVRMSVLRPSEILVPQLDSADFEKFDDLFKGLAHMQEKGCFGMLPRGYSDFDFNQPLPMATLPIAEDILIRRWNLTHPLLKQR